MSDERSGPSGDPAEQGRAERAGIVDQQDAVLHEMGADDGQADDHHADDTDVDDTDVDDTDVNDTERRYGDEESPA